MTYTGSREQIGVPGAVRHFYILDSVFLLRSMPEHMSNTLAVKSQSSPSPKHSLIFGCPRHSRVQNLN